MTVVDHFGVTETARGVHFAKTLANGLRNRQDKQGVALKPGAREQDEELARPKKENALLRMERDILKKAGRYFAKALL